MRASTSACFLPGDDVSSPGLTGRSSNHRSCFFKTQYQSWWLLDVPLEAGHDTHSIHLFSALSSPDAHAVLRLEVELVARLHREGVVPGVHVAQRAVDPEPRRRMAVARDLLLE